MLPCHSLMLRNVCCFGPWPVTTTHLVVSSASDIHSASFPHLSFPPQLLALSHQTTPWPHVFKLCLMGLYSMQKKEKEKKSCLPVKAPSLTFSINHLTALCGGSRQSSASNYPGRNPCGFPLALTAGHNREETSWSRVGWWWWCVCVCGGGSRLRPVRLCAWLMSACKDQGYYFQQPAMGGGGVWLRGGGKGGD